LRALSFIVVLALVAPVSRRAVAEPVPHASNQAAPAVERRSFERSAEPRGHLALVTGIAIGGGAFGVGSALVASQDSLSGKHFGLGVSHTGLALAPLFAHGVVGEWGRGALFAVPPTLGGASMAVLLASSPRAPIRSTNGDHRLYPIPILVSVVGAAIGVFDAALVDERSPIHVGASWDAEHAAVHAGGAW
jgi:hypothetical protein